MILALSIWQDERTVLESEALSMMVGADKMGMTIEVCAIYAADNRDRSEEVS